MQIYQMFITILAHFQHLFMRIPLFLLFYFGIFI